MSDLSYADIERRTHHARLTDPELLTRFRRRFPRRTNTHYDEMVRLLNYVWDCPRDRTANVVGVRCGDCGQTRATALEHNESP
jgi:hypothetical protein